MNLVKFVHIREYDNRGNEYPRGGMTVAFQRVKSEQGKDLYWVSKAMCSARDNFCKKTGRSIAEGRLICGMYDELSTTKTKMSDVAEVMINWAMVNGN